MKKKSVLIIIAIITVVVVITTLAYALFIDKDSKQGEITIGTVKIELQNLEVKDSQNVATSSISPGEISTINWTSNNIGTSAVLTRQTVEIYWDSDNSENGVNMLKLYPSNATEEQIVADFSATGSETSNLNVTPVRKEINGNERQGIGYQFLGSALDGTINKGISGISSEDYSFKLVLNPYVSYLFQNEPILVYIKTEAMQYTETSAEEWAEAEEEEIASLELKLFSDEDNGDTGANASKIKVELIEDTEWQNNEVETGIDKYTKTVKGESKEQEDTYVRVRCIPIVEYFDEDANEGAGEWVTAPVPQDNIALKISSEDWVESGKYWYYKEILPGFETTKDLNIEWKILELPRNIADKTIRTDVRVLLEYAKASHGVWKTVFGIDSLPSGVE